MQAKVLKDLSNLSIEAISKEVWKMEAKLEIAELQREEAEMVSRGLEDELMRVQRMVQLLENENANLRSAAQ